MKPPRPRNETKISETNKGLYAGGKRRGEIHSIETYQELKMHPLVDCISLNYS